MSTQFEETVIEKSETKIKRPSLYKVILHNDDYTPMDFVVFILESIFSKSDEEADRLMMQVHEKGSSICGIYPFGIAETKVFQVERLAEQYEYPLKCTMEKE